MREDDPALVAYQALASFYDKFTHANDYEMWLGRVLLPELERRGLRAPGKALDVACGTGRSFKPLMRRGWSIEGFDLSPAMLEVAAEGAGADVPLRVGDMRALPVLGSFDLVLCLNDSLNYLLGDDDLVAALARMRSNLGPSGLLLFDVNSCLAYANDYSANRELSYEGERWVWSGHGEVAPSIYEFQIEAKGIEPIRNRERFRSAGEIREALSAADLDCLASLGMKEVDGSVVLAEPPDETTHDKIVFIARPQRELGHR